MLEKERQSDRRDQIIHCQNFSRSYEKSNELPLTRESRLQRRERHNSIDEIGTKATCEKRNSKLG